jgi:hypothetical protein
MISLGFFSDAWLKYFAEKIDDVFDIIVGTIIILITMNSIW